MRIHHSSTGTAKVAMFRMRPRMGFVWAAVGVGLLGGLYAVTLRVDSIYDPSLKIVARLVTMLTLLVSLLLLIIATARMWYGHLWHRRK